MNREYIRTFDERFLTGLEEVTILSIVLTWLKPVQKYADGREGMRPHSMEHGVEHAPMRGQYGKFERDSKKCLEP